MIEPKGSHDLAGWTKITCWQAEIVRRVDLQPASSRTDMGAEGGPDVFTEWWSIASDKIARSVPVLREYLRDGACSHYLAGLPSEAAEPERRLWAGDADDEPLFDDLGDA